MLTQQFAPAVPKLREKEEMETVFRSFWDIYQQIMNYPEIRFTEKRPLILKNLVEGILPRHLRLILCKFCMKNT
jgi:hypothetical protein